MAFEARLGQVYVLNKHAPGRAARVIDVSPWLVVAVVYRQLPALGWIDDHGFPGLGVEPAEGDELERVAVPPEAFASWMGSLAARTGVAADEREPATELILASVPQISDDLRRQLSVIEPSRDRDLEYRPARAGLADGRVRDHIVFVEAAPWHARWGMWPSTDRSVSVDEVVDITPTMHRLPAHLAGRLYEAGETAMGATSFTIRLAHGRRYHVLAGNLLDLVELPSGVAPSDVVDVSPHDEGVGLERLEPPGDFAWCLYRT